MKFLDNTLSLLSIQLYHLRVIHAHILPTLDQSIPHHQIQMLAFPMVLILIIIGMVHLYQMRYLHLMLSLAWMFIITVGITIPPLSLRQAVALVVLINPQSHPRLKEQLERILMFRDRDPLCILSLLVTGWYLFISNPICIYWIRRHNFFCKWCCTRICMYPVTGPKPSKSTHVIARSKSLVSQREE